MYTCILSCIILPSRGSLCRRLPRVLRSAPLFIPLACLYIKRHRRLWQSARPDAPVSHQCRITHPIHKKGSVFCFPLGQTRGSHPSVTYLGGKQTNWSPGRAPCPSSSRFHAVKSSRVAASHHNGTRRARFPLAPSRRTRRCGRSKALHTSFSRSATISETRSPQQQASREITRSLTEVRLVAGHSSKIFETNQRK